MAIATPPWVAHAKPPGPKKNKTSTVGPYCVYHVLYIPIVLTKLQSHSNLYTSDKNE